MKLKQCKGCKKAIGLGGCKVFKTKPKKCWAYTRDVNWEAKIRKQIAKYQRYKNREISKYWEVGE